MDCTHVYFVDPLVLNIEKLEVNREKISKALVAEEIEGVAGGYTNLRLQSMDQKKIGYGSNGFP